MKNCVTIENISVQEVAQEPAQNSVQKRTLADRRTPFEWVNHVYLCRLEFMLQALLFFSLVREEKHGIPLSFHAASLSVSTDAVVMPVIPAQSGCSQADTQQAREYLTCRSHGHLPVYCHSLLTYLPASTPVSLPPILNKAARMILLKWDVPPLPPNPLKLSHHLKSQISTTAFEVYITWLLLLPSPLPFCLGHLYLQGHLACFQMRQEGSCLRTSAVSSVDCSLVPPGSLPKSPSWRASLTAVSKIARSFIL